MYDSDNSTSTRGAFTGPTGDILTLPVDSNFLFIDQPLATETENINPFAVISGKGVITLSPETDNWLETRQAPELIVDGGTITRTRRVRLAWGSAGNSNSGWNGSGADNNNDNNTSSSNSPGSVSGNPNGGISGGGNSQGQGPGSIGGGGFGGIAV